MDIDPVSLLELIPNIGSIGDWVSEECSEAEGPGQDNACSR